MSAAGREVDINLLDIPPRRCREDMGDLEGLFLDIQRKGQIVYPIVVSESGGRFTVLEGARRLICARKLGYTHVRIITLGECDEVDRLEIEYSLGETHKEFTWQERVRAELLIHNAKVRKYGAALRGRIGGGGWGLKDTSRVFNLSEPTISQDLSLAEAMIKYPELAKERTRADALRKLRKLQDGTELSSTVVQGIREQLSRDYLHGVAYRFSEAIEPGSIQLVISDITNYNLPQSLVPFLQRILSPSAHAFLFFGGENVFPVIQALQPHFRVSSTPYILVLKGDADQYVNYLWLSKNMENPPEALKKVESATVDSTRCHHRDLPVVFAQKLMTYTQTQGKILDPFAYSGSVYIAAKNLGLECQCFVEDETIYNAGLARLTKYLMPSLRGEQVVEEKKENGDVATQS